MPSIKQAAGADKGACDCSCGTSCSAGFTAACGCCINSSTINITCTNPLSGNISFLLSQSGGIWSGCASYTFGKSIKATYQCTSGVMTLTVAYYTASGACSGSPTGSCTSNGSAPNLIPESGFACAGGGPGNQFQTDVFTVTNANCPGLFGQGFTKFTLTP